MITINHIPETAVRREIPKETVNFELIDHDSKQYVTAGDTLAWYLQGRLRLYENNRGGLATYRKGELVRDEMGEPVRRPKFAGGTTKSVRKHFQHYSIGEYSVAKMPDGTHMFSEAESRFLGTVERYFLEPMTADELHQFLNTKISYSVVPEGCHINDYIVQGIRAKHTTSQKVWNPDLAYGHVIHTQVLPDMTNDCRKFYESHTKLGSGLGYMIYSMVNYPSLEWDFYEMYSRRGKVNFNDLAGGVKLSPKSAVKLANAACQYYTYYRMAVDLSPVQRIDKLFINDGWMGLYLVDRVTESNRLSKSDKVLATQTVRHYSDCVNNAPLLGGTLPRAQIEKKCEFIFKLLRKKIRQMA